MPCCPPAPTPCARCVGTRRRRRHAEGHGAAEPGLHLHAQPARRRSTRSRTPEAVEDETANVAPRRAALAGAPQAPLDPIEDEADDPRGAGPRPRARRERRPAQPALPWLPELQGSVEWATPVIDRLRDDARRFARHQRGAAQARGRIADAAEWSLGGLWPRARAPRGAWRPSSCSSPAEATRSRRAPATAQPAAAHALPAAPSARSRRGAVFVTGPLAAAGRSGERRRPLLATSRFLGDANHLDPQASITAKAGANTPVPRLGTRAGTSTPGGDILALSTSARRAGRNRGWTSIRRCAPSASAATNWPASAASGRSSSLGLRVLRDASTISSSTLREAAAARVLRMTNGVDAGTPRRRVQRRAPVRRVPSDGSVTYTYGQQLAAVALASRCRVGGAATSTTWSARVETVIDGTDTRVSRVSTG